MKALRDSTPISWRVTHAASLALLRCGICLALSGVVTAAEPPPIVEVEGQPLAANAERLMQALEFLGAPLPAEVREAMSSASKERDARKLQEALDPHVLCTVTRNGQSLPQHPCRPGWRHSTVRVGMKTSEAGQEA